ncbi:hypothetical protein EVC30_037 [Rhizobium phage RHph_Y1_11]|nr:hypothetical protein EVC30_037 [Rhizobium phage RHph_Y1_11]
MDQIVRPKKRKPDRSRTERSLIRAIAKSPLVLTGNSYWSPGTLRHFNSGPAEVVAKRLGYTVQTVSHRNGAIRVICGPAMTFPIELVQHLAQQAEANPRRKKPSSAFPVYIPRTLAEKISKRGDLTEITVTCLRQYLTGESAEG